VEVEVRSEAHEVHIFVRDQGPGVAEAELEKLFIPFYRVAEARERHTGGTGIGLAIARRAVELHRGRISATNRAGGGLEIEIVLPLNEG
jgi:two-component system sensor histidine kinase CpxA